MNGGGRLLHLETGRVGGGVECVVEDAGRVGDLAEGGRDGGGVGVDDRERRADRLHRADHLCERVLRLAGGLPHEAERADQSFGAGGDLADLLDREAGVGEGVADLLGRRDERVENAAHLRDGFGRGETSSCEKRDASAEVFHCDAGRSGDREHAAERPRQTGDLKVAGAGGGDEHVVGSRDRENFGTVGVGRGGDRPGDVSGFAHAGGCALGGELERVHCVGSAEAGGGDDEHAFGELLGASAGGDGELECRVAHAVDLVGSDADKTGDPRERSFVITGDLDRCAAHAGGSGRDRRELPAHRLGGAARLLETGRRSSAGTLGLRREIVERTGRRSHALLELRGSGRDDYFEALHPSTVAGGRGAAEGTVARATARPPRWRAGRNGG